MSSEGECVKVVVRCRPANTREKELKSQKVVKIDRRNLAVSLLKGSEEPKTFTFDNVYDDDSLQKDVYDETAFPLVKSVMEGYNGTIFAYGQTGCGKTFTMEGIRSDPNLRGIIPRTFDQIFDFINTSDQNSGKKFLVAISYVEIYNEEVRDLLSDNPKIRMDVKEDPEKGVFIKNLSQPEVTTVDQIEAYMNSGNKNRSVGATAMNATSSRSHSLFTVRIETSEQVDGTDEARIKAGKLNLVDLAGSERQSKTEATGDRLKEAQKINLSLSALGNVISALVVASSKGKGEDSLGGNTKTIMIAALSPAADNYDETLSTLRYANRAKNIKNKPKVNEDPKDAMLREFQDEIKRLKAMLEQHGLAGDGIPGGGGKKKKTKSLDHDQDDDDDEEEEEEEEEEERPKRVKKVKKPKKPKAEGEIEDIEDEEDDEDDDDDGDIPDETDGSKPKKKSRGGLRSLDPFASPAEQEKFADEKAAYEAELAAIQLEKSKHETFIRHLEDQMKAESAALDELKTQTEAEKAAALAEIESRLMKEKEEHETKAKELEEEIRQTKEEEQKRVEAHKAEIQSLQNEALNEKLALKAKLKKLQQKLIDGGQKHKTAAQEAEEKARLALEEAMKTRQAEAREREAKLALEEEKLMLEENYTSIKDEVIGKTKKLKKLKKKLLSVQQELDDSRIEWEQEKEGYLANIRDSAREVKLYRQIAAQLLTKSDLEKIVRGSVWQEAKDEWQLPKIDLPVFFPTVRLIPGVGQNGGPTGSATATGGAGAGSASSSSNNGVRTFGRRFEEEKGPDGWKKSVTAGYSREDYQPNANGRAVSRMAQQSVSTNPPPSTASHRPPPPTVVPKKLDSLGSGARKPSSPDTSDPITASAAIARRPAFEGGHVNNSSQEDQHEHILNVLDSAGTKATFVPAGAPISNNHYSSSTDSILNDLDSKAPRKASFQPSGQFPSSTQPSTDDAIHTLTHTEVAKRPAFSPAHAALPSTDTYDPLASTLQNGPAPRAAFNPLGSNPLNSSFDSDVVKKPAFDPRSIDPDIPKATLPMDLPVARSFQPAGALVPARLVAATQAAFGSANDPIISPKAAPPPRPAFSPAKF